MKMMDRVRRSVFCRKFPDRCIEPSEEICSEFPSYCGKNKTLMPKEKFYDLEVSLNYEEILSLGDNLNEFLVRNIDFYNESPAGPFILSKYFIRGSLICYNLHSLVNSSQYPKQKKILSDIKNKPITELRFYVEEEEMFLPADSPGVYFAIHSPFKAVNPSSDGIFLTTGKTYKIYVTSSQDIVLKEPYERYCKDYEEIWEENNRTGPRMHAMCMQQCTLRMSMKCLGCRHPFALYPSNEKLCVPNDLQDKCTDEDINLDAKECRDFCKDDCKSTRYTTSTVERYETVYDEDVKKYRFHFNDRYINVEIYLEASEVTRRRSPKHLTVEVFCIIGGFIAYWLGITLMDVIDVMGTSFMIVSHAFKKITVNNN